MEIVTYINEKNYKDYLNLDVLAFSYAHPGAMGYGGEIIVITKEAKVYSMNYAFGDMKIEMCNEVCPPLRDCVFGLFNVERTPKGWEGIRLGCGNFLVLAEPIYNQLKQEMANMPSHILYGEWMDMVLSCLNADIK